ncbi:UNVERIFIED_CONTAM: art-1 [Trichonephila clavipes]
MYNYLSNCILFFFIKCLHRIAHTIGHLDSLSDTTLIILCILLHMTFCNTNFMVFKACQMQIYGSLAAFILAELGNLSIHLALRNLRPEGTNERKIPVPTGNPFTWLFNLVSCPNYTYEVMAWISFSVMTNCLPAGIFTLAGFYQMAVWAQGKHRNYKKEFSNYPKGRKAIIPFIL